MRDGNETVKLKLILRPDDTLLHIASVNSVTFRPDR